VGNEEAGRRTLRDDETYMPIADISVKDLEMKQSADVLIELIPATT